MCRSERRCIGAANRVDVNAALVDGNSEVISVPIFQPGGVLGPKEDSTDALHFLHGARIRPPEVLPGMPAIRSPSPSN